jgi:23S rRNA (adenine2503-C2)-methyltransferase
MSVNAACPLPELQSALQYWYRQTGSKVTFEYVVWAGVNDTDDDIRALLAFTARIPSKVNLIQYNAIDQGPYQQAGVDAVEAYRIRLLNAGVAVSIRRSRGSDIDAACGQLAGNLLGEIEATTESTAVALEANVSLNLKTL